MRAITQLFFTYLYIICICKLVSVLPVFFIIILVSACTKLAFIDRNANESIFAKN